MGCWEARLEAPCVALAWSLLGIPSSQIRELQIQQKDLPNFISLVVVKYPNRKVT